MVRAVTQPSDPWTGFLDDAAIFPPGDADLADAVAAYLARTTHRALVGPLVLTDVRVPELRELVPDGERLPVSIVVTTGAGGIEGALKLAARAPVTVAGLEIALRDPDDLPGNARRVTAAVDAARDLDLLPPDTVVHVELPPTDPGPGWLGAADEVAAMEHRLKLRTGGVEAHLFPSAATLAAWIDAALDRETPFKCTAGMHHPIRHRDPDTGFEHHGFLNVLLATRELFDGASAPAAAELLDETDAETLVARAGDLASGRRWFTSLGTCSIDEPVADLISLGLLQESA